MVGNIDIQVLRESTILTVETEEFPAAITRLVGEPGDRTRLVLVPEVLEAANRFLKTESWRYGSFREQAVVFLGKVLKTSQGDRWIQVRHWVPVLQPSYTSSGAITFSFDGWAAIQNALDAYRQEQRDVSVGIIGWGHTHPEGWEGRFSETDQHSHGAYFTGNRPDSFMYIFGAGNKHAADTVGDTLTSTHAFFSYGGGGGGAPRLGRHRGIYLYTQPLLDIKVVPVPTLPIRVMR